uniref:Family with sequence similarity 204 member A n=1 Tax=Laticauda laticaudata TaxID=8630 RepID=A0A8C5RDC2_LATLA
MWSGLLPPGVNEADVAVSSDNEETVSLPESMLNEKQEEKKFLDKQTCDHEEKNMAENQLPSAEQECLACLPGVPLDMWNVGLFTTLYSIEPEILEYAKERHFKELTQYFGINDRFKPLESKETTQKSGLEISIDKCVAEGNIAQAEELSDRLATRELGVKIAKAVACRNFVKAKQDVEVIQEARKKKKLAWGFEAKKRWETKSNMGYM